MKFNKSFLTQARKQRVSLSLIVVLFGTFGLHSCTTTEHPNEKSTVDTGAASRIRPIVSTNGEKITFSEGDSSRKVLTLGKAEFKNVSITTTAPARIILTTVSTPGSKISVPVFETSDLTQLFTDYTRAKHDLGRATRELERLRDLFAHNAVAGKDVTQAESDQLSAQVTLTGLESRLLTAGLSANELEHLRPDISLLLANVPESEITSVQMGEDAQIEFDSFRGEIMHGRVLDIGHAVDPTTRTFNVRIELANKVKMLRPGMFARASFGVDVLRRFVVPQSAVVSVQGKSFVFVTTDGKSFERREVTLGQQSKSDFIIMSGLAEGESVVTEGAVLLKGLSFGS
jgi:cobalt-zinc-cadmium efflux system membrane fusion protein